ncbi:MAG: gamma carbonic anhydrase family protein [Promethearchaeota archaeon]
MEVTTPNIIPYNGKKPNISKLAYVDPRATIIGNVTIGDYSSIWAGVLIMGDDSKIVIGSRSNIQEHTVIHTPYNFKVKVGDGVTIAHGCIIHGCEIEDSCCVSIGGGVFDGASIGKGSIVDSFAFVTEGIRIPPRTLVHGNPGRPIRVLTDHEQKQIQLWADWYVEKVKMILARNKKIKDAKL